MPRSNHTPPLWLRLLYTLAMDVDIKTWNRIYIATVIVSVLLAVFGTAWLVLNF